MSDRPNILLIHTHDTGRHLGCYGVNVDTPHINRIAQEGALFRQTYCVSPSCSASRSGLMTSLAPHNNGMLGLNHRGFSLNDPKQHLSHLLRNGGYRTQLIGLQHEIPYADIDQLGYDGVVGNKEIPRLSQARAKIAVEWLSQAPQQPFFLNVGFTETHRPHSEVEAPEDPRYTAPLPWLPDDPKVRKDVAELQSSVRHVDEGVGLLLEQLDQQGLAENTLVIYTTDHGVAFPRAKATLFDAGIGVALTMRGPGGFRGGQVHDALVSQLDLLPTFLEVAQIPVPEYAQGVSLTPLVRGEKEEVRHEIFSEVTYHAAYDPMRCIRTRRHKYIRFFEDHPRFVLPNIDNGYSKELLVDDCKLPVGKRAPEMLYDLASDPQEFENLADSEHHQEVKAELSSRLQKWMEDTDDPLLKGKVPLPEGAITTPIDAYNPAGDDKGK